MVNYQLLFFIFIFWFTDANNNSAIFNELHSNYADSEVSNTSNSLEESSSNSSIYDDKDVDLSVYLNFDQFNKSNVSRTLRKLDGSSSSLFSVDDDVDNDVLSTDSAEWNYNNPSCESDISNFWTQKHIIQHYPLIFDFQK